MTESRGLGCMRLVLMLVIVAAGISLSQGMRTQLAREETSVNGIKFEMVTIPPGDFLMGSETGFAMERPVHRVSVNGFALGKTEVTVKLFRAFADETRYRTLAEVEGSCWQRDLESLENGDRGWKQVPIQWRTPGFAQTDEDPVVCISWDDAVAFCEWLSRKTGRRYRLPTELEWEYACRAGTKTDETSNLENLTWYRKNSGGRTHPVGSKQPNAWGLYDMQGNAWEWCADQWTLYPGAPAEALPGWARDGKADLTDLRPLRGGAWGLDVNDPQNGDVRASSRNPYPRRQRCNNSGLRIAESLISR